MHKSEVTSLLYLLRGSTVDKEDKLKPQAHTGSSKDKSLSPPGWKEGIQDNPPATRGSAGLLRERTTPAARRGSRCRQIEPPER